MACSWSNATRTPITAWGLIATRLGTKLDRLLAVNSASGDTVIVPGQQVKVPAYQPA